MQNFKTAFGSEVSIENGILIFTDENNVSQSITLSSIRSVEDNIKQLSDNPELLAKKRKVFVSILYSMIALVGILVIYKFVNPEVVERFKGGGTYLVEETSYITPIFFLIIEVGLVFGLIVAKKSFESSDLSERNEIQDKKDWILTIKALKNDVLIPFQVCKGHASEIRKIKHDLQEQTQGNSVANSNFANA
jgi:hypothetical protein